jgi:hypothetical protein
MDTAELKFDPVTGGTVAPAPKAAPAPTPAAPSVSTATLGDRLVSAGKALALARVETTRARQALHDARAKLTAAKVAHAESHPATMSFQDNVRDYLEAQRKEKIAAKNGEAWAIKKTHRGRGSYIDVAQSFARGTEDVNSAARARNKTGFHRGAFSAERLGTANYDPSRGTVRRKVAP